MLCGNVKMRLYVELMLHPIVLLYIDIILGQLGPNKISYCLLPIRDCSYLDEQKNAHLVAEVLYSMYVRPHVRVSF